MVHGWPTKVINEGCLLAVRDNLMLKSWRRSQQWRRWRRRGNMKNPEGCWLGGGGGVGTNTTSCVGQYRWWKGGKGGVGEVGGKGGEKVKNVSEGGSSGWWRPLVVGGGWAGAEQLVVQQWRVLSPLGSLRQAGHTQVAQPCLPPPLSYHWKWNQGRGLSGENWKQPAKCALEEHLLRGDCLLPQVSFCCCCWLFHNAAILREGSLSSSPTLITISQQARQHFLMQTQAQKQIKAQTHSVKSLLCLLTIISYSSFQHARSLKPNPIQYASSIQP